jgi:hypothetical protein
MGSTKETYVENVAPQYRVILKKKPDDVARIPPNASDQELDTQLHRIKLKHEAELKEEGRRLVAQAPQSAEGLESLEKQLEKFWSEWNEEGKAELARYVVHRRATLDWFDKLLQRQEAGGYVRESAIHKLIMPMSATSADVAFDDLNLWIVDERLAFHHYMESDRRMDTLEAASVDGHDRPDLVAFNRPAAFAEALTDALYSSIVIVEFKRPMRDDYEDGEDPVGQVIRYIREIREGTVTDKNGRTIPVQDSTRFFAYIICDTTPKLQAMMRNRDMRSTADGAGHFMYHEAFRTYIEVIPFPKLLADARKRNNSFFEKLHLQ